MDKSTLQVPNKTMMDYSTLQASKKENACLERKIKNEKHQKFIDAVRQGSVSKIKSSLDSLVSIDDDNYQISRKNIINQTEDRDQGGNALYWAMREGHLTTIHYLFENGADVNLLCNGNEETYNKPEFKDCSLIEMVRMVHDHDVNIEKCAASSYFTPLQIASRFGKTAVAELLLQRGAHIQAPCITNIEENAGKFCSIGISLDSFTQQTPLILASLHRHQDTVELLKIYLALAPILKNSYVKLLAIKVCAGYLLKAKNDFELRREPLLLQQTIDSISKYAASILITQYSTSIVKSLTDNKIFDFELYPPGNASENDLKDLKKKFAFEIQRSSDRKADFTRMMEIFLEDDVPKILAANFREHLCCHFRTHSLEDILNPNIAHVSLGKHYNKAAARKDIIEIQKLQLSQLKDSVAHYEALCSKAREEKQYFSTLMAFQTFQFNRITQANPGNNQMTSNLTEKKIDYSHKIGSPRKKSF